MGALLENYSWFFHYFFDIITVLCFPFYTLQRWGLCHSDYDKTMSSHSMWALFQKYKWQCKTLLYRSSSPVVKICSSLHTKKSFFVSRLMQIVRVFDTPPSVTIWQESLLLFPLLCHSLKLSRSLYDEERWWYFPPCFSPEKKVGWPLPQPLSW